MAYSTCSRSSDSAPCARAILCRRTHLTKSGASTQPCTVSSLLGGVQGVLSRSRGDLGDRDGFRASSLERPHDFEGKIVSKQTLHDSQICMLKACCFPVLVRTLHYYKPLHSIKYGCLDCWMAIKRNWTLKNTEAVNDSAPISDEALA